MLTGSEGLCIIDWVWLEKYCGWRCKYVYLSSKGRRDRRRANWKMTAPTLVKCSKCGELMVPHRVCKNCGSYNKKEIIAVD